MDTRITTPLQSGAASMKESLEDIGSKLHDHEEVSSLLANIFGSGVHTRSLTSAGLAQPPGALLEDEAAGASRQPAAERAGTPLEGDRHVDPLSAAHGNDLVAIPTRISLTSVDPVSTPDPAPDATPAPDGSSSHDSPSQFVNGMLNPAYVSYKETQVAAAAAASNPNGLTGDQIATLSVLDRHQDKIKGKMADLQKQIDDPKTPPDLKRALQNLQSDPDLQEKLDAAKSGKRDGNFAPVDVTSLVKKHPEVQVYNQQQAEAFVENYIPSDNADPDAQPRAIGANDAMREFYRYSDSLPKNLSQQDLQNIVDGTGGEGKMPPQVIAAAKYFLAHPSDWQTIAGPAGRISRGHMEDNISKNVSLNDDESKTIATLQANSDTFFSSNLSRDKLRQIADDPNSSPEVQQAAEQLLSDPMLFGMLDNAKHGNSGDVLHAADDGKIGKGDLDAFVKSSNAPGKPAPSAPPTHTPKAPADVAATEAMRAGEMDQPEEKKEKGGGLMKFLRGILNILSKIYEVISTVLSVLAKIPGIGPIFAGLSVAAEVISGQLHVGSVAAGGGSKKDILNAEKDAAIGLAGAALGSVTLPGVGGAILRGAEKGIEKGFEKVAVKAGSSEIRHETLHGAKDIFKDKATDAVSEQFQNVLLPQQNQPTAA